MPKKKKMSTTTVLLIIVLLVAVVSATVVAWHDGKIGVTPLVSINNFEVDSGTPVTVRGVITSIGASSLTISDGLGAVSVPWADTSSFRLTMLVVVRAIVNSIHTLTDVTSVEPVWLFA